jgi:opacity protein-like surface antigen
MAIRFKVWILGPLLGLLASPTAFAAAVYGEEYKSYVSVNAGVSQERNACATTIVVGANCTEKWAAYRLAYGYQFTPAWGVELSYGDLGYAEEKGTLPVAPPPATGTNIPYTWSLKAVGWAFAGTGTLNLGQHFSLFGKLGGVRTEFKADMWFPAGGGSPTGWWYSTGNTSITRVTYGAGIQINFTPRASLRAQYEDFGKYDLFGANQPKIGLRMASGALLLRF